MSLEFDRYKVKMDKRQAEFEAKIQKKYDILYSMIKNDMRKIIEEIVRDEVDIDVVHYSDEKKRDLELLMALEKECTR